MTAIGRIVVLTMFVSTSGMNPERHLTVSIKSLPSLTRLMIGGVSSAGLVKIFPQTKCAK